MKNVLWTGGWDSTYRLMDLLTRGELVQPIYIVIPQRKSTKMEIQKMDEMRDYILEKFDNAKELLLPLRIIDGVKRDPTLYRKYKNLTETDYMGSQYIAFATYAEEHGINNLELSIHIDDKASSFIKNDIELINDGKESYYKLKEKPSDSNLTLFKYFRFPMLEISKLEMEKKAKNHGFFDVMEMTWFCHLPNSDGSPCGVCNPCVYTKEEGLGRRVPKPLLRRKAKEGLKRFTKKYVLNKFV